MTTVPVTKCPPDPRLFYNRRWGKTSCSKKGNRNYSFDYVRTVSSSFPTEYEKESMNIDIKSMACYSHGVKPVIAMTQAKTETQECIDILENLLEDL